MCEYLVTYMYYDKDGKNVLGEESLVVANKQNAINIVRTGLEKRGIEPLWLKAKPFES